MSTLGYTASMLGAKPEPTLGFPAVRMRGVSKSFVSAGQRIPVLQKLDLSIQKGSFFAVVGASGSGKSTLLNLLGGLDLPSEGSVEILGTELTALSEAERTRFRRDHIGFVFQFYNLLPTLTALENVELSLELRGVPSANIRPQAVPFLAAVGLEDRMHRFPGELSGGEQQRVAIARALAKDPKLLLADEPTGNLDRTTARGVIALMRRLSQSSTATFVVVTHDEEVSALADASFHIGGTPSSGARAG